MSFLDLDEIVPKDIPVFLNFSMKFFIVTTLVLLLLLSSMSVYFSFEMLFRKGPWRRSTARGDLEAFTGTDINVNCDGNRTTTYPFYHAIYNPSDLSQSSSTYCIHFDANTSTQVTVSSNVDIILNVRRLMSRRVASADEKERVKVNVRVVANDSDGVEADGHGQLEESVPLLNAGNTDGVIGFGGLKI